VGEFLILVGSFGAYDSWASIPDLFSHPKPLAGAAALGVILSAVYMLYLFQKVMFGPITSARNRELKDLSWRETAVFVPMLAMAFWLGLYPATFLSAIDPAVSRTVSTMKAKWAASQEITAPQLLPEGFDKQPLAPAAGEGANPEPTAPVKREGGTQ
jgi:NADH-quinone oxidoreductase subunit M